jgi:hypothetical protein
LEELLFIIRLKLGGLSESNLAYMLKLNHYTYKVWKTEKYQSNKALKRLLKLLSDSKKNQDIIFINEIEVLEKEVKDKIK